MGPFAGETKLYFEDVEIGMTVATPGMTLTETHVALFGGLTDDRPADPRAVPGLLPLCLSSGLGWRTPLPPLAVLALTGFEWRFLQDLHVGDTIRCVSRSVAKRLLKEGGIVIEERDMLNQRGEVVQAGKLTMLVAKRPASNAREAR